MELEGKINMVMPANSGVSQRTGNAWMSQEYVLAYYWFPNQTNPSYIVMRMFGEKKIKKYNLQPNDEVRVRYHCDAHETNGRWYNELMIDGVTFLGASAYKNQQQPAGGTEVGQEAAAAAEPQPTENSAGNQPQGDGNGEGKGDDLPF